ncbi:MAG: hypothetical protein ABIO70_10585 [Pseudomonadota bacterium]
MREDKFSFEGLEPIERRILRLADEIGYLVLTDRTHRHAEEKLGRLDLSEAETEPWREEGSDAAPWSCLASAARGRRGVRASGRDDEPADPYDGEDDEPEEDAEEPGEPREPLPMKVLAEAGCRWVREVSASNAVGEPYLRLRLRVYAPKGDRMLFSGQFVCRNHGVDLDIPQDDEMPDLKVPVPTFDQAASQAGVKGIKALGDFYAQWGRIVLGAVGELQGVNNSMLSRLHRQLQESRDQIDMLVASILEHRVKQMEAEDSRMADERAGDARTALAKEAISQLGSAAQAFLAAKGVSPEMAELLGLLSNSQELTEALKDPAVRKLMQDPDNLSSLAALLRQAATQAAQAEAQAQQQGAQPPGAVPPPQPSYTAPAAG